MSKLTIQDGHASTNFSDDESCSDKVSGQKTRALNANQIIKRLLESTDKVDRRILQLLMTKQKSLTAISVLDPAKKKPNGAKVVKFPPTMDFD